MKMYLISDNVDTQKGMRLSGVGGCVVHTKTEIMAKLDEVLADKDIGIVLITEKLAKIVNEQIRDIKLTRSIPLVVEIPDRHGSRDIADSINRHVKEAIGLRM